MGAQNSDLNASYYEPCVLPDLGAKRLSPGYYTSTPLTATLMSQVLFSGRETEGLSQDITNQADCFLKTTSLVLQRSSYSMAIILLKARDFSKLKKSNI
jgi:hypothetical protein